MSRSAVSSATPKENLRGTLIVFAGIVMGVLVFMLIAVFISQANGPFVPQMNKYHTIITWGMAAISLVCLFLARQLFNKGLSAAKNSLNPLNDKLNKYRSSLIRYLVICEAPALLSIVLFIFTGNFVFQVFSAIFLGFMLAVAPARRRVVASLELNGAEQTELE